MRPILSLVMHITQIFRVTVNRSSKKSVHESYTIDTLETVTFFFRFTF